MISITDPDPLLAALGEQLDALGQRYELVVVGGSGLLALGATTRATQDVDIVALREGDSLVSARPLPEALVAARDRVSQDFGVPPAWLNGGPTSLLDFGLPEGFLDRVVTRDYGAALTVHFASRYDQIHFKLYALVDNAPGKHEADLRALKPSRDELIAAALWSRTHDPSEGFREMLAQVLEHMGVRDADLGT